MYQELFNINYRHEYFNSSQPLNLTCELPVFSQKLCRSMNAIVKPYEGGVRFFWDSSSYPQQELKKIFKDDHLIFYFFPKDKNLFYNVTEGLDLSVVTSRNKNIKENIKRCSCFQLFSFENHQKTKSSKSYYLFAHSEPVDKLSFTESIESLPKLSSIDISNRQTSKKIDDSIREVYTLAKRKPLIVLHIPLNTLLDKGIPVDIQLNFLSVSVFYKYYFTNLDPNKKLKIVQDSDSHDKITEASDEYDQSIRYLPSEEILNNGKPMQVFTSDKPIKLKQLHKTHYQLVLQENNTRQTLIECLPQPKPNQYFKHVDEQNNPITVLEAFIN